jgi:pimeloyl-ACP methyl ester carboxylesterase
MVFFRNCTAALLALVTAFSTANGQQKPRNPTDSEMMIPGDGFNLAATVTAPASAAAARVRHPAVILVPGSGPVDRDETVAGIPIFAQLAGALAQQGFLVVRYDKRGVGRSGGRDERATIEDYAGDALSIFRWLKKRKDVDKKRISIAGHSEGGAVAMIAGAREEDLAALVLIAAPGTRGADLILEQQRHLLEVTKTSEEEREAKIDLQQKIQLAVMTGVGWEALPAEMRKRADTPWFKSLLEFDPAKWMRRVKQPLLLVHGALDKQVPSHHADKLAALARQRKKNPPVEVAHLAGVNHLLVRAKTGEFAEYKELKEKTIDPEVAAKIAEFLRRVVR